MTKELTEKPESRVPQVRSFFDVPLTLEQLAQQQGVKPFHFDELLDFEARWPEDESVDDFISVVREWRADGQNRRIP